MGNRAIIKPENGTQGVYLHWNGGRDSVEPFLEYCKLKEYRGLGQDTSYGLARLTQVISNFFGGSTSIGVVDKLSNTEESASYLDNGIYLVDGWDIVGRIPEGIYEQKEYDRLEMLIAIDEAQPEKEQLGSYIGAVEIPTKELKVGDIVYHIDFTGKVEAFPIVGISEDEIVNGSNVLGVPYINKYSGAENNPNNYIREETVRLARLTDEYKKIKCKNIREQFEDEPNKDEILLYIPEFKEYLAFSFGDGTNGDNLCEDCDDYIYITQHEFNNGEFEEVDGGQLDFNTEEKGYNNNICNAIFDVLDFIYGCEANDFEVMQ